MLKSEINMAKLRVLVVEDDATTRDMIKEMLTEIGITQVFEATDGPDGISLLDMVYEMIDLIICDWNLPGCSGLSLLRQIRCHNDGKPFLMLTGRKDLASVVAARESGVSAYICKPFSIEQLETKIKYIADCAG